MPSSPIDPSASPPPSPSSPPLTPLFPPHHQQPSSAVDTLADCIPLSLHLRSKHPHIFEVDADTKPPIRCPPQLPATTNPVAAAIEATEEYMRTHSVPSAVGREYLGTRTAQPLPLSPPYIGPGEQPGNRTYDPERREWIVRGAMLTPERRRSKCKEPAKRVSFMAEEGHVNTARGGGGRVVACTQKKKKKINKEEERERERRAELKASISEPLGLVGQAKKRREEKKRLEPAERI